MQICECHVPHLQKPFFSEKLWNLTVVISNLSSIHRAIRVWLKRDSGQYWPSVHHTMPCKFLCLLSVFDHCVQLWGQRHCKYSEQVMKKCAQEIIFSKHANQGTNPFCEFLFFHCTSIYYFLFIVTSPPPKKPITHPLLIFIELMY